MNQAVAGTNFWNNRSTLPGRNSPTNLRRSPADLRATSILAETDIAARTEIERRTKTETGREMGIRAGAGETQAGIAEGEADLAQKREEEAVPTGGAGKIDLEKKEGDQSHRLLQGLLTSYTGFSTTLLPLSYLTL